MKTTKDTAVRSRRLTSSGGLLAIAWVISSLEGYDLAVYGASVPAILKNTSLGVDVSSAGFIGSLVGIGMLVGAAFAGAVVHRFGPLRLITGAVVIFSLGMLMSAVAPSAEIFGLGRLVVGLGLGVVLPTINAYIADLSTPSRVSRNVGLIMSGYAAGALCAPLFAAALVDFSFRWLYVIGVVPVLVLAPLLRKLPESPVHLRRTGRVDDAEAVEAGYGLPAAPPVTTKRPGRFMGLGALLAKGVWWPTLLFWVMSFCGLLLVFGISAWLPTIMQDAGYSVGSALLQAAAMWVGVGVGVIAGGRVADVVGPKSVVVIAFLVGTISLVLMSLNPTIWILYVLMFVSGFGFIGAQIMGNALIVTRYPAELRGNGLPWALAVGRLGAIVGPTLGAVVLSSGVPSQWNFYAFAIPALIGASVALLVPRMIGDRYAAAPGATVR
ncbi:MFS transporter, AAHS family, benzoate transport protein [Haloechinothrix alba]|uniref:MFS transporter, AAHS family, benzoate transport protein n=1 Tax=Haloechinothrix alba TaxID=664784 RepID=A0A238YWR8_9PSEU|nr:MFS transporter [Haloechinothrix alba]SNR75181.1 MFS transporter, AAHS family, benzoate transport protein [Haloechinothrix alba]